MVLATYENERYALGSGWSARNLLPTDRWNWSNATGTEEVTRESIRLPSDDWEWEGEWQLDFDLRKTGEVDEDGWEYAHDFPRRFGRVRKWSATPTTQPHNHTVAHHTHQPAHSITANRRAWLASALCLRNCQRLTQSVSLSPSRLQVLQCPSPSLGARPSVEGVSARWSGGRGGTQAAQEEEDGERPQLRVLARSAVHPPEAVHAPTRRRRCRVPRLAARTVQTQSDRSQVRGGRRRGRTDETLAVPAGGLRSTSNLLLVSQMPTTRRAQSISSQGYSAADTSLLSYFHIRNNMDDSIVDDEEGDGTRASHPTVASQRGPSTLVAGGEHNPFQLSQSIRSMYPETMSPLSPAPSPSLSRVAATTTQFPSSSSAPSSPLLALPTQHQIRLHDPKLLLTSDILSMLATLAEQYGATVQELVAKDRVWLDKLRKEEREKEKAIRLAQEAEAAHLLPRASSDASNTFQSFNNSSRPTAAPSNFLSSIFTLPSAETPSSARRGSFSVESTAATGASTLSASSSTRSSPLMRRPRLASAEEASRRSTLPINKDNSPSHQPLMSTFHSLSANTRHTTLPAGSKLPNVRDSSASRVSVVDAHHSHHLPAIHDPDMPVTSNGAATPPTSTLPISSSAVPVSSSTVHFNCDCHIMEAATQREAQELFCIEIINPQFNCHSEETRGRLLLMTSHVTLYGRVDWIHSLHLPHQDSPYATRGASFFSDPPPPPVVVQATSTTPALPIVSRDKFRVTAVLDDLQAFVAPTDIDVDAGVVWMNKQNVGVLKSILQPATLQVNASFRPEMMPITTVHVPDKLTGQQQLEERLHSNLNGGKDGRHRDSSSVKKNAADKFVPTSHALLPSVLSAGPHHLIFSPSDSNQVDVSLPQLTFALDAYQFSLLLDVIKVISTPPTTAELKDELVDEVEDAPLLQLQQRAAKQQIRLYNLVWEMKWIEVRPLPAHLDHRREPALLSCSLRCASVCLLRLLLLSVAGGGRG